MNEPKKYTQTSGHPMNTETFEFYMGIDGDGRVVMDFNRPIVMWTMTPEVALKVAEGLVESAIQVSQGIQIPTPSMGNTMLGK